MGRWCRSGGACVGWRKVCSWVWVRGECGSGGWIERLVSGGSGVRVGGRWVGEMLRWVVRLVGNRCGLRVDGRLVYRVVGLWRSRLK